MPINKLIRHVNLSVLAAVVCLGISVLTSAGAEAATRTQVQRWIVEEARQTRVPASLALAIAKVESNFQDSVYDKALSKFTVICNIHGKFTIRPNDLKNGHGCPTCGVERTTAATAKDDVVYKEELKNIHEDTVECIGDYVNTKTKILHRCTCCKLEWLVTPAKMLQASHACPACRPSNYTGFKLDAPATLYYLSINNGEAYKIGVTNRSIQKRYSRTDLLKITVLKEWYFDIGQDAYSLEQSILIQYKEFKYIGKKGVVLRNENDIKKLFLREKKENYISIEEKE